jgi:hypothetical protein
MKNKPKTTEQPEQQAGKEENTSLPGYPLYPDSEDIFDKYQEEKNIDPEDTSRLKNTDDVSGGGVNNEKDFADDFSGSDLDVPGSESDDAAENIGSEDEENNYYSIGGEDHEDLDEDKGDS